ncbi:hypothetical protein HY947_00590 [Candidatus Gottesmanbacteria bacterium]|nr:hypothetical protein [Candidatus Gottesmanbacteria bacterium]
MKVFIVSIVVLVLIGFGGYIFVSSQSKQTTPDAVFKTEAVTKVGIIQIGKGDDYNFVLMGDGKTVGITSYTVKIDPFVGKKVEVKGQYSGTTLYADSVTLIE